MIVGCATAALAAAAAGPANVRGLVPPPTNVANRRARAPGRAEHSHLHRVRAGDPTGSVATFAQAASGVPGSGEESVAVPPSPRAVHPAALDTVTADAEVESGNPHRRRRPPWCRGSAGSRPPGVRCPDPEASAPAAGTACAGGIGTRCTVGFTACGAAPTRHHRNDDRTAGEQRGGGEDAQDSHGRPRPSRCPHPPAESTSGGSGRRQRAVMRGKCNAVATWAPCLSQIPAITSSRASERSTRIPGRIRADLQPRVVRTGRGSPPGRPGRLGKEAQRRRGSQSTGVRSASRSAGRGAEVRIGDSRSARSRAISRARRRSRWSPSRTRKYRPRVVRT